jgi:hypothetical protein
VSLYRVQQLLFSLHNDLDTTEIPSGSQWTIGDLDPYVRPGVEFHFR